MNNRVKRLLLLLLRCIGWTAGKNLERIVMTGSLPQGQESLFWLNIKAIPSASKQMNSLQIAVKTRIKLIYRPEALRASTPEEQANKLTWRRAGNTLLVNNPTPYVINFNEITLGNKKLDDVTYVMPSGTARFRYRMEPVAIR